MMTNDDEEFVYVPIDSDGAMGFLKAQLKKTCYVEDRSRESVFNHLRELREDHEMKMSTIPS